MGGGGGGLGSGFEREPDRGVARTVRAGRFEESQAGPVGCVPLPGQPRGQHVAGQGEFRRGLADDRTRQQRRRCLSQRAGPDQHPDARDAAVLAERDVDRHPAAADGRAFLDGGVRIGKADGLRGFGGEAEDFGVVQLCGHRTDVGRVRDGGESDTVFSIRRTPVRRDGGGR